MNFLTSLCSDHAAQLISEGQLTAAIGPLLAARRYGGGAGLEQNAAYLAWRLSERARAGLLDGRKQAAALDASFALCLVESPQALFILANADTEGGPAFAFGLAARMETIAPRDAPDLRIAALKLMIAAWLDLNARGLVQDAAAAGQIIAARLARCRADHPAHADLIQLSAALDGRLPPSIDGMAIDDGALDDLAAGHRAFRHLAAVSGLQAEGQTLDFLAHFAAAEALGAGDAALDRHRAHLGDRLLHRYHQAIGAGGAAPDEALALLCAYSRHPAALDQLLQTLVARGDADSTLRVSRALMALAAPNTPEWRRAAQIADETTLRLDGRDPALAEAEARAAAICRLDEVLLDAPDLDDLRYRRAELNLKSKRIAAALADFRLLVERARAGAELSPVYRRALAANTLILLPSVLWPETAWAAAELAQTPPEELAAKQALLLRLVEVGATLEARRIAEQIAETLPEYRLYADFAAFVEDLDRAPVAQFGRKPGGRRRVYASLICWGAGYLEMLESTALASLASPGNLPALAQAADIVIDLLVGPADVAQALAMPILRRLAESCEIRIVALPFPDGDASRANRLPYVAYGHASHFTLLRARRDGADLLNLHPDIIYADGALGSLGPLMEGAPRVVLTDGLNVAKTALLAALGDSRRDDGPLTIEARRLAALSAPHWMPRLTDCLYDPDAASFIHYPHRLVFREADRVVMHSFCKFPLYVANEVLRGIQSFNFATIDGYLLDSILDQIRRDQIVERMTADPTLLVELSDDEGVRYSKTPGPLNRIIAEMFSIFPFSARRLWLFENGVDCFSGAVGPILAPAARLQFLADLRRELAGSTALAELDRERDRIRPAAARGPALSA